MNLFLALLYLLFSTAAYGQSIEHLHILTSSGTHLGLSTSPSIVVRAYIGKLYKWDESEKIWILRNDPYCGDSLKVSTATLSPTGSIYDHLSNGWNTRSDDGGVTFRLLVPSDPFVISPVGEWFHAAGPFVCRSRDEGKTWDTIRFPFQKAYVYVNFDKQGTAYFVGKSVFRLVRGANELDSVSGRSFNNNGSMCSLGPDVIIYGVPSDSTYVSLDGGRNWVTAPAIAYGLKSIASDSSNRVFATTWRGNLLRSDDTGHSWIVLDSGNDLQNVYCQGPATMWCASNTTMYQYIEAQHDFIVCDSPFEAYSVWSLGAKHDTVFAGSEGHGVFRSTDNGDSWSLALDSAYTGPSTSISFAPDGAKYYCDGEQLLQSYDGMLWSRLNVLVNSPYPVVTIDSSSNIYLSDGSWSSDKGQTWYSTNPPEIHDPYFNGSLSALGINSLGNLCGAYNSKFYYTTDHGQHWDSTLIQDTFAKRRALVHCGAGRTWLAYDSVLLLSYDGGLTWSRAMDGLTHSPQSLMTTDPSGHTFCVQGDFFYGYPNTWRICYWNDRAKVWQPITRDTLLGIWQIASNENYIFIGAGGVYRIPISSFNLGVSEGGLHSQSNALAYPNPSTGPAILQFHLAEESQAMVVVFDVLGHEVLSKNVGMLNAGSNSIAIEGQHLPTGVYSFEVRAKEQVARGQIVISH